MTLKKQISVIKLFIVFGQNLKNITNNLTFEKTHNVFVPVKLIQFISVEVFLILTYVIDSCISQLTIPEWS